MSYETLKNTGIWQPNGPPCGDQRTLIVVGVARSGTSMVAGTLQALGVPMGDKTNDIVFEDQELARVFEENASPTALEALLQDRNERHRIWGWKRPRAFQYIEPHLRSFRNPALIVTFRDALAIAMRNAISVKSEVFKGLRAAHRETRLLLDFVTRLKVPAMLVSYEKAMLNPSGFVAQLAEFAGMELTTARAQAATAFIQPNRPEYLRSARAFPLLGGVGAVRNGYLVGWAKDPRSDQPVTLQLEVNGEPWREVRADQLRKDLKDKNIGTGRYGFRVNLSELRDLEPPIQISVIETASGEQIRNSPWILEAHRQ